MVLVNDALEQTLADLQASRRRLTAVLESVAARDCRAPGSQPA